MAKKSRKNRQQAAQPVTTPAPTKTPEELMTAAKNSVSQEEFESNKSMLLELLQLEIDDLEGKKRDAEQALNAAEQSAKAAQSALDDLRNQKEKALQERNEMQQLLEETRNEYDAADEKIKNAEIEAESVRNDADIYYEDRRQEADTYAENTRRKADEERIKTIKKAHDEAKAAWQTQTDELSDGYRDIANREKQLREDRIQLNHDRMDLEFDREAIKEKEEDLASRKARYESANPAKVATLETQLDDERNRYASLERSYQEKRNRLNELEVFMASIQLEMDDPDHGIHATSMTEIVTEMQRMRERLMDLESVHERYPDYSAIEDLEEKARKTDKLEHDNEVLKRERTQLQIEASAARDAGRTLDVLRREVEATNALNEHLLKELESHKTALESRTGDTCPSLTKVDKEVDTDEFKNNIEVRKQREKLQTLQQIVEHVRNYAGGAKRQERLYYTRNDIRAFLAGMAVSRLIILQGMSGTGKSSLPRIFSQAISGDNRLIPVESSWRDRNELLGYYNDFNKKFNAKSFTIELYRSGQKQCDQIPTYIVLDEMNLARIEYYFSDFLAILQEPDPENWLIELVSSDMRTLPMELPKEVINRMMHDEPDIYSTWKKIESSRQGNLTAETSDDDKASLMNYLAMQNSLTGAKNLIDGRKIKVTKNIWFVGTANRDESTFEISDKVYDRAQVVSLDKKAVSEGEYTPVDEKYISTTALIHLFDEAIKHNSYIKETRERLAKLDAVLMEFFDVSFGNRIETQTIDFVGVFTAAGGTVKDALDYQISTKILRKVLSSDNAEALLELEVAVEGYPKSYALVQKRIKELNA